METWIQERRADFKNMFMISGEMFSLLEQSVISHLWVQPSFSSRSCRMEERRRIVTNQRGPGRHGKLDRLD